MKLSASKDAKEKAEVEKEVVVFEKLKSKEHSASRYKRLRRKYNHYKNKSKRLLGQLAFVSKFKDFTWGRDHNWGFENFRTLELNPTIYPYDKATIDEVKELGKNLFLGVPDWSADAPNPWTSVVIA